MEECNVNYIYIKGKENILPDTFSTLLSKENDEKKNGKIEHSLFNSNYDDQDIFDCFVNYPVSETYAMFPQEWSSIKTRWLQQHQFKDNKLCDKQEQQPKTLIIQQFKDIPIICYRCDPTQPTDLRIYIPSALLQAMVQ